MIHVQGCTFRACPLVLGGLVWCAQCQSWREVLPRDSSGGCRHAEERLVDHAADACGCGR